MVAIELVSFESESVLYRNIPKNRVIPENMDPGICWLDFSDWRLGVGVVGMRAGGFGGVTDFWIL